MDQINEYMAKVYGHLISDGSINITGSHISYHNKELDLIKDFNNSFKEVFNREGKINKSSYGLYNYVVYSKKINSYFKNFDISKILEGNEKIKASFLQACFDDEGSIGKEGTISICQKKIGYILNIRRLLMDLKIKNVTIYKLYNKIYKNNYYYLRISKKDNERFSKAINFIHSEKRKRLGDYLKNDKKAYSPSGIEKRKIIKQVINYKGDNMKQVVTLRGDRELWLKFSIKLKKQRKEVWEVLEPFIKNYLKRKGK